MPYDSLQGVTGPLGVPGNPIEAAAITVDADGTKGYVYVGTYREGHMDCRIAGAFDRTTGDETLTFEVWEANDAAGTGAAVVGSSAALTASNMADTDETGDVTLGTAPTRVGFVTAAGGYVKARFNVGGTTPSAASVSSDIVMHSTAVRQSGS